jgi:hypothetical protein
MPSSQIPRSTQLSWLALVEFHNWSTERIASTWNEPVALVAESLSRLSMEPIAEVHKVPRLPATPAEGQQRRAQIQQLYRQGWSIERLARSFFYYSVPFLTELCQQAPPRGRACTCGCGERLRGKQLYATPACKQKAYRRRAVPPQTRSPEPPLARAKA